MNVKWIIGKKTFTVLALLMVVLAVRELLTGDLLTALLALTVAAFNTREAENRTEITVFEIETEAK